MRTYSQRINSFASTVDVKNKEEDKKNFPHFFHHLIYKYDYVLCCMHGCGKRNTEGMNKRMHTIGKVYDRKGGHGFISVPPNMHKGHQLCNSGI